MQMMNLSHKGKEILRYNTREKFIYSINIVFPEDKMSNPARNSP